MYYSDGTPLPEGHCCSFTVSSDWYLSSNGHDTSSCGESETNACGTLDWLLDQFYQTSSKIKPPLSLITDSDLVIDKKVVVSICYIKIKYYPLYLCEEMRHVILHYFRKGTGGCHM